MKKSKIIIKSQQIHKNKYDYSLVEDCNTNNKIKIICPSHGIFEQRLSYHLLGGGCKKCSDGTKYLFDQLYFDTIDNPLKAYWLGFITADGYIHNSNGTYSVAIALSSKDANHLKQFCIDIGYNNNISTYLSNNKEYVRVSLYSKRLVDSLLSKGVTQKKSLIVKPYLNHSYIEHYWRGIFDGDGSFMKLKGNGFGASLIGNEYIINGFQEYIFKNSGFNGTITNVTKNIKRISYGGINPPKALADLLYKTKDKIGLQRKIILADEILMCVNKKSVIQNLNFSLDDFLSLYEKFKSWSKVSLHLNITRTGLMEHLRKHLNYSNK